jgi:hypothetical protein
MTSRAGVYVIQCCYLVGPAVFAGRCFRNRLIRGNTSMFEVPSEGDVVSIHSYARGRQSVDAQFAYS